MAPSVHLDLAAGIAACGAQERYIEAFTFGAFELLEQPVPDDLDLTLHVLRREELEQLGRCELRAGGCATRGEAWVAGSGAEPHELTHMVLRELAPPSIAALAEGIAESLGTPSPYWPEPTPRPGLAGYATKSARELDNAELIGAGLYTTFLLDEYGPQAHLGLYRSLPRGSGVDEVDARMREYLGASLAELDARFADPTDARCMNALAFCGDLYGPVSVPPFEIERSLECEDSDTLGYTTRDGVLRPFRRWQMAVPRAGTYRVEAEGAVIHVLRCGSCEERDKLYFNGTALMDGMVMELDAGLYTLEVNQLLDGHETFRLAIREQAG